MSINSVTLLGNLGRDPEIRTMANGDKVASFSLATSERWTDKNTGDKKENTEWHNVVCFNQALVKIIDQYVKKGSTIGVVNAQIKTRKYTDKNDIERYATEIVISRIRGELTLEGRPNNSSRDENSYGSTSSRGHSNDTRREQSQSLSEELNDDIPF